MFSKKLPPSQPGSLHILRMVRLSERSILSGLRNATPGLKISQGRFPRVGLVMRQNLPIPHVSFHVVGIPRGAVITYFSTACSPRRFGVSLFRIQLPSFICPWRNTCNTYRPADLRWCRFSISNHRNSRVNTLVYA